MPVWHAKAQQLVDAGKLVIVGIVEEQHADRCRLYLQWQQIGWPMMYDPINKTGQSGVPIFTAIDEYGIVRLSQPDPDTIERDFVNQNYPKPASLPAIGSANAPDRKALRAKALHTNLAADWREYADAETLWGGMSGLEESIAAYRKVIALDPGDATAHFRLGVCYRLRYDSLRQEPGDFQKALDAWQDALDREPNQYIWRRRIQQYGPRLEKPYPFYDWVRQAREAIRARGETPTSLVAEPSGAETAAPIRAFAPGGAAVEPDPHDRILRDPERFIHIETATAPTRIHPGETVSIHLILRPNPAHRAHWNNEAEPLRIWVRIPEGWAVDPRLISLPNPPSPTSTEVREADFEIRVSENTPQGLTQLPAYVLYYVCEDVGGQCLFRRQDVTIPIQIIRN